MSKLKQFKAKSVSIPNETVRQKSLSLQAKGFLSLLLSFDDNWSFNFNHLMSLSSNGRDATRNAMNELTKAGYLKKTPARDPETGHVDGWDWLISDTPIAGEETTVLLKTRKTDNPYDGKSVGHKNTNSLSLLTTNTPPTECKEEKSKKVFEDIDMPESLKTLEGFAASWEEWLTHRKQAKKPVTPLAAKKQLEFLSKEPNPIACIDHAIAHNWQGLYPLKNQPKPKKLDIAQNDWNAIAERYAPDGSTWEEWNELTQRMGQVKN